MMMRKRSMEMKFKFIREVHNEHSTSFHTNVVVGKGEIDHYAPWLSCSYSEIRAKHGQTVADMVSDLRCVRGVHDIFVKPYGVSVHLNWSHTPAVRWDEKIDRIVERAFRQLYEEQFGASGKKVVVKGSPNPRRREFCTKFEVSKSLIEHFYRPLRVSSEEYLDVVGPDGAALVTRLMELPGVVEVFIEPHEVTVYIGEAFDWTERNDDGQTLEDKIKKAFEQVFGNVWFVTG